MLFLCCCPDVLTGRFNIYARSFTTGHVITRAESISAMFFEKRGFLENSVLIQNEKFHGCRCCGNTVQSCSWRVSACLLRSECLLTDRQAVFDRVTLVLFAVTHTAETQPVRVCARLPPSCLPAYDSVPPSFSLFLPSSSSSPCH